MNLKTCPYTLTWEERQKQGPLTTSPTTNWDPTLTHHLIRTYRQAVQRAFTVVRGPLYLSNPDTFHQVQNAFLTTLIGPTVNTSHRPLNQREQLLADELEQRLKDVDAETSAAIARVLQEGINKGLDSSQVARKIQRVVGFNKQRAKVIARTELVRATAQGQLDAYRTLGMRAQWVAGLGCCKDCCARDGKVFSVDKADGLIPVHPNCLCSWRAVR